VTVVIFGGHFNRSFLLIYFYWRRRFGRPIQCWFRQKTGNFLRPLNVGFATAKRRAQNRSAWRLLVVIIII